MKLVPYDLRKVNTVGYKKSDNYLILTEFVESDLECAKVEGFTQSSASGAAASLRQSIKRYRMGNIDAISRGGELFLIKKK
jgi:hypothetical protein